MGGFYLCRDDDRAAARLAGARVQFDRHGFPAPADLAFPGWRGFHCAYIDGGPATLLTDGDDFAAVAGTLVCDGKLGTDGLGALLGGFAAPLDIRDRCAGHFALLARKNGRTLAATDFFGAFQLFHDAELSLLSTSFLAAAASDERLRWDKQGVYEYAFGVAPTGDDTVFAGIRRLGPGEQLELGETVVRHRATTELRRDPPPGDLLAALAGRLRGVVAPYAAAFGDKVQCPLSGGLDSRLALALLRDAGVAPHVYVYGAPGGADADIALEIGAGEGFAVETFDKSGWRGIDPGDFAAQVERNFHATDALVTDGGLFDDGANAFARHARAAGGQLAVSGGCGEVFRNFFYLSDARLTARQLVEVFFARYHLSDTTDEFDARAFIDALEAKARAALGPDTPAGPLDRAQIEELYPRLRCRSFFGREISLVGRHGAYLMPFFEPPVIELALQIPLADKNLGRFEQRLIETIDPRLAAYPSAYGHRFTEPPTWRQRASEWSTRIRPIWLRRRSYTLQRAAGRHIPDDHAAITAPDYLARAIDPAFPHMRRFFRMGEDGAVGNDIGLYRRIATLEYLGQFFADRLRA